MLWGHLSPHSRHWMQTLARICSDMCCYLRRVSAKALHMTPLLSAGESRRMSTRSDIAYSSGAAGTGLGTARREASTAQVRVLYLPVSFPVRPVPTCGPGSVDKILVHDIPQWFPSDVARQVVEENVQRAAHSVA
jgi:hypothetical protein